jgi:hypothetical protein
LKVDTTGWPIHAKEVKVLDWKKLHATLGRSARLVEAESRVSSPAKLGMPKNRVYGEKEMPHTNVTEKDEDDLVAAGKMERFYGIVKGYAMCFTVDEGKKKRRRFITNPVVNDFCEDGAVLKYRGRWLNRAVQGSNGAELTIDIDMTAYFDQFELSEEVRDYFVLRTKNGKLYRLTRLLMGARFAPGVAQSVTWELVSPLMKMEGVTVITMIDNVRIASSSSGMLIKAVRLLQARLSSAGVTVNDMERPENFRLAGETVAKPRILRLEMMSDAELLQLAAAPNKIFLGEKFTKDVDGSVCISNTESNINKLQQAWSRLVRVHNGTLDDAVTPRHMCSFVSLLLWLINTIGVPLYDCQQVLRAYGGLARYAIQHGWDTPVAYVAGSLLQHLAPLVDRVVANQPVHLPRMRLAPDTGSYDVIIIVDACANGWGAYVAEGDIVHCLRQRWQGHIKERGQSRWPWHRY